MRGTKQSYHTALAGGVGTKQRQGKGGRFSDSMLRDQKVNPPKKRNNRVDSKNGGKGKERGGMGGVARKIE